MIDTKDCILLALLTAPWHLCPLVFIRVWHNIKSLSNCQKKLLYFPVKTHLATLNAKAEKSKDI